MARRGITIVALLFSVSLVSTKPHEVGKLQGKWRVVTLVENGKEDDPKDLQDLQERYLFVGARVFLKSESLLREMSYQVDDTKKPARIELIVTKGPLKGLSYHGIYEVDGKVLRLAFSEKQHSRPMTFVSTKDSHVSSMVLVYEGLLTKDEDPTNERAVVRRNLEEIGRAMVLYRADHGRLPTSAILSKDGKALLSWRVALLPYLFEEDLFKAFRLDEPWDSPRNKRLLTRMPSVYSAPWPGAKSVGVTFYEVFAGRSTLFEGNQGVRTDDMPDGAHSTIMLAESAESVPWTKPTTLDYDPARPLPKLGGLFGDGFHVVFANGSARFVKKTFDEQALRRAISRNDGEHFDSADLDKQND